MIALEPEAEQGLKPIEKIFSCGSLVSPFSGRVLIVSRYPPEGMTNTPRFALSPCGLHKSKSPLICCQHTPYRRSPLSKRHCLMTSILYLGVIDTSRGLNQNRCFFIKIIDKQY